MYLYKRFKLKTRQRKNAGNVRHFLFIRALTISFIKLLVNYRIKNSLMYSQFINQLKNSLQKKLPGESAQKMMAPNIRFTGKTYPNKKTSKDSGVLILFYPDKNSLFIPFIQRPNYNGVHGGQISLPGGKFEIKDINLRTTALRETKEEIGVPNNQIEIIGHLSPIYIPNSNFNVTPFVGYAKNKPKFIPDSYEVQSIIEAPLNHLLSNNYLSSFKKVINNHTIEAPYFNIEGHIIWGATAMIISELKVIIQQNLPNLIPLNFYNAHNVQESH